MDELLMTTGQIDKILKALTDLRVAAEQRFTTLEVKLDGFTDLKAGVADHEDRLRSLELSNASRGRLSWTDIGKFITAVAALEGAVLLILRSQ
jgi:hypothetical protein